MIFFLCYNCANSFFNMYKFTAEAAEMTINGEIDAFYGENLRYIDYDLQDAKDVKIFLNSGGGQVTEGFAIADRLRRHGQNNNVSVTVCGLCASIATMIHAAGSTGSRKMTANSFYMIHNTAVFAEGGSKTLRSLADTLDTMTDRIAENYVDVIESNNKLVNGSREETKEQVLAWMDNETWFSAQQALNAGLVDAIETAQTYITPESAQAIKNQIRNCVNVPTELMTELDNNITAEEKSLSELRLIRTSRDAAAYRKLMFARYYHGVPLKFLTLTFKESLEEEFGKRNPYKLKLQALMNHLREKYEIEYLAVETKEGNTVFHLALICGFIHHSKIRHWWCENTGAWNVHISREKNLPAFLSEMTGQKETVRYSTSRNFVPKGTTVAIQRLKCHFSGKHLTNASKMLARRLKNVPMETALYQTRCCIERGYGAYSDISLKRQILLGKTN